ncbi:unnamed protein product, partial [marine sediment metagenome]
HHVRHITGPTENECVGVTGETSCQRVGEWFIPGIFSRMGMSRCRQCCKALGAPNGTGSPKNDPEMKAWME